MNTLNSAWLVLIVSILILEPSGCATQKADQVTQKNQYPVVLYVNSENGGGVDPVNISVVLDYERHIIDSAFHAHANEPHFEYMSKLSEGRHQIVAGSKNGNAGLDVVFTVDKPLWLCLSYWGQNHFQLLISKSPIGFL